MYCKGRPSALLMKTEVCWWNQSKSFKSTFGVRSMLTPRYIPQQLFSFNEIITFNSTGYFSHASDDCKPLLFCNGQSNKSSYHPMYFSSFSLAESSPRDLQISVLLQIIFCSCVMKPTLLCENGGSGTRGGREWFDMLSWSKERWSNDKTSIELGYRKISWFASVLQNNYLPQPSASANNWSARHWEITIFYSSSLNNC